MLLVPCDITSTSRFTNTNTADNITFHRWFQKLFFDLFVSKPRIEKLVISCSIGFRLLKSFHVSSQNNKEKNMAIVKVAIVKQTRTFFLNIHK